MKRTFSKFGGFLTGFSRLNTHEADSQDLGYFDDMSWEKLVLHVGNQTGGRKLKIPDHFIASRN